MTEKPNFLVFMTDQHRADWLGCMGHPIVRTPNIDAIAAKGARFTDFHVAMPVCMPNRASFLTSRMPSVHGLRYNGCVLPERANTFVDVLAAAGYDTAMIGKSHLQPFLADPPKRPPRDEAALIAEAWKTDQGDYLNEQPDRYEAGDRAPFPSSYYGYGHVDMVTGHGDRCGGHYQQWFRETRSDWRELTDPLNETPHNYSCPQAYRTPIPEDAYPTTWIADRAIDHLGAAAASDAPFFTLVSFPDPHHPFNPPGRYWDMYDPDEFELPLPSSAHQNPTPPMRHATARYAEGLGPETPQTAFQAADRHVREAMALTAGMITMIDDQIGRVIEALKASGAYENTVILFTSDHGDYLGDFNLLLKGAMPFRAVTRVPMIWSDTDRAPARVVDGLASTIDIGVSILKRAGLAPFQGVQGQSFLGALNGEPTHRDELLIEHNDPMARSGFETPARVRTLVTKDWRLSCYLRQEWGELYHLADDPNETRNLWDDPAHADAKGRLSLRLIDQLTAQMDESPLSIRHA